MQAFKTLLIVAVLSAVAYGVYAAITGARDVEPPPGATTEFGSVPQIELPSVDVPQAPGVPQLGAPAALVAPPPHAAAGDAPTFASPSTSDAGAAPPFVAPGVGPGDPTALPASAAPYNDPAPLPNSIPPGTPSAAYPGVQSDSYSATPPAVDAAAVAPPPADAMPAGDFKADLATAQTKLAEHHLDAALQLLSRWYDNPQLQASDQQALLLLLNQLAGTVIYSREHLLLQPYDVQPGDTLDRVAQRYQVPWQLLAKINGVSEPNQIRPGDKLKVVQGPFDAVVNLRTRRLTLFLGSRFAGSFAIGVASEAATPDGDFTVQAKTPNPKYLGTDYTVEAGDPNNPLGKYWIGLTDQLGIHGTNDPQSIDRVETRGCIRLNPRDIEDVYDMLTTESRVRIYR